MSRRRSSKQDSLELLLDTICNTFGGVLFIAILVVLLLQQTGKAPASTQPVAVPRSEVEMQALMARAETVADELDRLRKNRHSQDAVARSFAPDEVRQLLERRSEVTMQQEALQSEIDQLLASNTGLAVNVENIAIENEDIRERLGQARSRLLVAEAKLEENRQSRVSVVRMPVLREARGKQEIGLVLSYGRLYVWHNYDQLGRRLGLNTDDFVVVEESEDGLICHPNPIAGVLLDESATSKQSVRNSLRRFDPKEAYLVVVARPDTFSAFHHLRDRAIELGFEYRLMPVESGEQIFDRGGRGGRVQ